MSAFLNFIVNFFKYLWNIIKNTTVDVYKILKNLDDFLFKYSTPSISLIFTFVISRYFNTIISGITSGVSNFQGRQSAPIQTGGAVPALAAVAKQIAANPALAKQAMGLAQQVATDPVLSQQVLQQQPIPQVAQPQIVQQPIPQVAQPQIVQQPIPQAISRNPTMKQRYIQVRTAVKEDERSKIAIFLILFIIYAVEHTDDCRNKSGGSINIKSYLRNGFWTIGFSYLLTMILTNIGPYGMIKKTNGTGIITDLLDGVVLYFVYNLVKNFRNITDKNTCETTEGFDDTFKKEQELRFKYEPSLDEAVKELEKQKKEFTEYKKSNKMPTVDEQIPKAQRLLKNANIFIGRKDIFQAIDKLQQQEKEINLENLKSILNVDSPKPIMTLKQQELALALPSDRRRLKSNIKSVDEVDKELNILKSHKKQFTTIDDIAIRSDKGRIIGINLEKLADKRIKKLQNKK
jgi:hypothetical protein